MTRPPRGYRGPQVRPDIMAMLPPKARRRLRREHRIDRVACWLIDHHQVRLGWLLWRITGLVC